MSITQGGALPDIKQTTTREDTAPSYYTNYLSGLSTAAQAPLGKTGAELVAGYDPMQTAGYAQIPGAAASYIPGLTAAQQTAAGAAQGITPDRISALMNPYTQNVVNEMARLSQQNVQRNIMPALKAGFVGTGGLGSDRYASALGQSMADIQSGLTGKQYTALSEGYNTALNAALQEAQLENQAAQTQGALAQKAQELGLTGAGALTKAGAERQAYEQSLIDAPLKTATTASNIMRGFTIPTTQTETFVGPKAGLYEKSPLEVGTGVLSILGAMKEGSAGNNLANWLGTKLTSLGQMFDNPATPGFSGEESGSGSSPYTGE